MRSELFLDRLYLGDCIQVMADLPPECVDLIITDPPFAIDFKSRRGNYNRKADRVLQGYSEIPAAEYAEFTQGWLRAATRILKESGSMFIFSGWNHLKDLLIAVDECALTVVNHLIWKYQFGVVTRRKFVTSHYHCLYVCRDDRQRRFDPYARYGPLERTADGGSLQYRDREDVWVIPREYWQGDRKTPTKLPRELISKILAYASEPGDVVCDPFVGSGQVAVVSRGENRRYIGIEIVKDYLDFAQERLDSGNYRIRHEIA